MCGKFISVNLVRDRVRVSALALGLYLFSSVFQKPQGRPYEVNRNDLHTHSQEILFPQIASRSSEVIVLKWIHSSAVTSVRGRPTSSRVLQPGIRREAGGKLDPGVAIQAQPLFLRKFPCDVLSGCTNCRLYD
jgi:hypothetical protein